MSTLSSISPALDRLADLARHDTQLVSDPASPASSLLVRLSQVPDRRKRRGRRHELVVVLVLTACATLVVGNNSVAAIWQWSAGAPQEVLRRIGARRDPLRGRYLVPSERTFRRVLSDLDADALDLVTCGFAADVIRGAAPVPVVTRTPGPVEREERRALQRANERPASPGLRPAVAVDGKVARGSGTRLRKPVFLLGAISHVTGVVLGQRRVPDKKVGALLRPLDAAGMVFTLGDPRCPWPTHQRRHTVRGPWPGIPCHGRADGRLGILRTARTVFGFQRHDRTGTRLTMTTDIPIRPGAALGDPETRRFVEDNIINAKYGVVTRMSYIPDQGYNTEGIVNILANYPWQQYCYKYGRWQRKPVLHEYEFLCPWWKSWEEEYGRVVQGAGDFPDDQSCSVSSLASTGTTSPSSSE